MKKKRVETSKKALGGTLIFCACASTAVIVGWFMGLPDALGILGLIFALGTLVVKFYMEKAKAENLQKIKRDCKNDG